jgi:GT2 family glycosyltransferase
MNLALITIVSGRHSHLVHQHEGLAASTTSVDSYVVVTMDDPIIDHWRPAREPFPLVQPVPVHGTALPLAAARNTGARTAIQHGADLLVFLDVDCIPTPDMLTFYREAALDHPDAVLSGAVGYQQPDGTDAEAHFHGFRPRLAPGETAEADPQLFWSLSFAVTTPTWRRIGGFCEDYEGYGGEDTDFAMLAQLAGAELLWVGGAESFHQYHPTSDPPVEHLDDILKNGALFRARWGFWPMEGWLRDFESLGLVHRDETGEWQRMRVNS